MVSEDGAGQLRIPSACIERPNKNNWDFRSKAFESRYNFLMRLFWIRISDNANSECRRRAFEGRFSNETINTNAEKFINPPWGFLILSRGGQRAKRPILGVLPITNSKQGEYIYIRSVGKFAGIHRTRSTPHDCWHCTATVQTFPNPVFDCFLFIRQPHFFDVAKILSSLRSVQKRLKHQFWRQDTFGTFANSGGVQDPVESEPASSTAGSCWTRLTKRSSVTWSRCRKASENAYPTNCRKSAHRHMQFERSCIASNKRHF